MEQTKQIEMELIDGEEEKFELFDYEFNPKDINIITMPMSLDTIISRIRAGEIDMNTEFQRKGNLWNANAQSRLIESLLVRFPLPAFYFDASNNDKWLIVDGLQRLSAVANFVLGVERGFPAKPLKLKNLEYLKDFEGMTYKDLPDIYKRRLKEETINAYIIKDGTPEAVKFSLFERINTGGMVLNSQEIRHALNQYGRGPNLLAEIAESVTFTKIVRIGSSRMQDRELILRFFAYTMTPISLDRPPIVNFLNDAMRKLGELPEETATEYTRMFYEGLNLAHKIFDEHVFSKTLGSNKKPILNRILFDIWMIPLSKLSHAEGETLIRNKHKVVDEFKRILRGPEFDRTLTIATSKKEQLIKRFKKVDELVKKYSNTLISYGTN